MHRGSAREARSRAPPASDAPPRASVVLAPPVGGRRAGAAAAPRAAVPRAAAPQVNTAILKEEEEKAKIQKDLR